MAARSRFENLKREARVSILGRLAGRLFTRKTTGFDGFLKQRLAGRAATIEPDPELARVAEEMRGRSGKLG